MRCFKGRVLLIPAATCIFCVVLFLSYTDMTQVKNTASGKDSRRLDQESIQGQRFPCIFIIGFGKTGTRALYDTLRMHSKVIGPVKEMRFFDDHYHLGLHWYMNQMQPPLKGQRVAEKSPSYILNHDVPARLINATKLFNVPLKELKFVVMFRHPIIRAISEYLEWQSSRSIKKQKPLARFDELALDKYGQVNINFIPLSHSVYIRYLKQWLQVFKLNQFCFVHGEMFAERPHITMSKLEKCLELPPEISKDNFVWKKSRQLYCLSYNGKVTCPSLSKGRPHPFVQQDVVDVLMKYFKPFNEELYSMIGENYNWDNNYKGLNVI